VRFKLWESGPSAKNSTVISERMEWGTADASRQHLVKEGRETRCLFFNPQSRIRKLFPQTLLAEGTEKLT